MPRIDNFECLHLQRAAIVIREQIGWGEAYVTGVSIKRKRRRCKGSVPTCPVLQIQPVAGVGDVTLDPTHEQVKKDGHLIPRRCPF